jgi:hypothetical protein
MMLLDKLSFCLSASILVLITASAVPALINKLKAISITNPLFKSMSCHSLAVYFYAIKGYSKEWHYLVQKINKNEFSPTETYWQGTIELNITINSDIAASYKRSRATNFEYY